MRRSQTTVVSRWFVMPMAATSEADKFASASTSAATPAWEDHIFFRVVLDPAGLRENLLEFALCDTPDRTAMVEKDGSGAGCALVEGENVFWIGHGTIIHMY